MTETDGTRRVPPSEAAQPQVQGVDPTVRYVTRHTTGVLLVTLALVTLLAVLGYTEAAIAAAAVGAAGGVVVHFRGALVQVHFHHRR